VDFSCFLVNLEVIDSAKKLNSLVTDVVLLSYSLKLHIHRLEFNWLTECSMESGYHRAS